MSAIHEYLDAVTRCRDALLRASQPGYHVDAMAMDSKTKAAVWVEGDFIHPPNISQRFAIYEEYSVSLANLYPAARHHVAQLPAASLLVPRLDHLAKATFAFSETFLDLQTPGSLDQSPHLIMLMSAQDAVEQLIPERLAADDMSALANGPRPPAQFVWNGVIADVQPLTCRLMQFMWTRDKASFDDVATALWGESGATTNPDAAIRTQVSRATAILLHTECPFQLSTKSNHVLLSKG